MRCNFYPRCKDPQLTLGTGPHWDPNSITILHQHQIPAGLQVFVDNKWKFVTPRNDAFVINIGDTFQVHHYPHLPDTNPFRKLAAQFKMGSLSLTSLTQTLITAKPHTRKGKKSLIVTTCASNGGFSLKSIINRCEKCGGQGAIECPGCKGTGKNKKNGNIFERWKCYECQGFGLKSCPVCGTGGLTPEQRGER